MTLRVCSEAQCYRLIEAGAISVCPNHRRQRDRERRTSRARRGVQFYHSAAWLRFRRWVLARRPTCEMDCKVEGRVTPGKDVDHIQPISTPEGWRLRLTQSNVRVGCHPCHSRRTARDQSGWRATA